MTVSWGQFEFSIDGKKIENIIGHQVEKDAKLGFAWVNENREFQLNEQISFSEQEILNICFTAFASIDAVVVELQKYIEQFVEVKTTNKRRVRQQPRSKRTRRARSEPLIEGPVQPSARTQLSGARNDGTYLKSEQFATSASANNLRQRGMIPAIVTRDTLLNGRA